MIKIELNSKKTGSGSRKTQTARSGTSVVFIADSRSSACRGALHVFCGVAGATKWARYFFHRGSRSRMLRASRAAGKLERLKLAYPAHACRGESHPLHRVTQRGKWGWWSRLGLRGMFWTGNVSTRVCTRAHGRTTGPCHARLRYQYSRFPLRYSSVS